jgi:hypothetical protein
MCTSRLQRRAAGLVLATLLLAGCGTSQITGKVRFQDQVLTAGTVKFLGADGKEVMTAVAADGSYRVAGVAPGLARVSFVPHAPNPFSSGATAPKPVAIPKRYKQPETSGLECVVRGGRQEYNLELQSP